MPTDVDAILAYGYDLGGPDHHDGWHLHNTMVGKVVFPWWDSHNETFGDAVRGKLNHARMTRRDVNVAGVEAVWYGSDTRHSVGAGYILAATHYSSYFSHGLPINPDVLAHHNYAEWDERLQWALAILDIVPQHAVPRWILAASHGI
jgi:hypothetical protein